MNIEITVENKIATAPNNALIVCGNSDYTMSFNFDAEWDAEPRKTVRLVWHFRGKTFHKDILMEGDRIDVPVLTNAYAVFVGVYAGDLRTTTRAKVPCAPCILCCDEHEEEADSSVVARMQGQLMKLLAESLDTSEVERIVNACMAEWESTAPKVATITLPASEWSGDDPVYSQRVTIAGLTENSQVDLHPTPEQLSELLASDISMTTANDNGVAIVYAIGAAPEKDYIMQIRITEVQS